MNFFISLFEGDAITKLNHYFQIVFAVDMGDNRTFSVSQTFPSPYQLCDNRWHSVKANYVENALTLKVDNQDEQYGFSTNGHVKEAKTRNPLFIGGLPGSESCS